MLADEVTIDLSSNCPLRRSLSSNGSILKGLPTGVVSRKPDTEDSSVSMVLCMWPNSWANVHRC